MRGRLDRLHTAGHREVPAAQASVLLCKRALCACIDSCTVLTRDAIVCRAGREANAVTC